MIKLPDVACSSFAFSLTNNLHATVHTLLFTHAIHTCTLKALLPMSLALWYHYYYC